MVACAYTGNVSRLDIIMLCRYVRNPSQTPVPTCSHTKSQWKKRSAKTNLGEEEESILKDDQKSINFSIEQSLPLRSQSQL